MNWIEAFLIYGSFAVGCLLITWAFIKFGGK